jgi:hypothetical protein
MPNYQYRLFKNEMKKSMEIVQLTDTHKSVMRRVMRLTKEYDIPISPADVELELVHDQWSAKIYWEETIEYFPFYPLYQKNLEFYVDTTE